MNSNYKEILNKIYLKIVLPLFFLFPFIFIYIINELSFLKNYLNIISLLTTVIIHYLIFCLMNKRFIFPFRFNKNIVDVNYYFNSGKSWIFSFLLIFISVIGYLFISGIDDINIIRHFMNIALYSSIYANYGFVYNVGMESIIVRNNVKYQKIYRNNLNKMIIYSIGYFVIINILSVIFIYYLSGNTVLNHIGNVVAKSDFMEIIIMLIVPKILILFLPPFVASIILIKFVAPVLFENKKIFANIMFLSMLIYLQIIVAENILIYINKYSMIETFIQLIFSLNFLMMIVIIGTLLFKISNIKLKKRRKNEI